MTYYGNPPLQIVNSGWEYFMGKSGELLWKTQQSLDAIAYPLYGLSAPVITYAPPTFEEGTFVRPTAPTVPLVGEVDASVPSAPSLSAIALDALPAMPAEPDFSGLAWAKPGAPNVALPSRPSDTDVALVEIDIPATPAFVMPADPTLYQLNLPAIPDLDIPAFEGTRPTLNLQAPAEGLNWAYEAYNDGTIDFVKARLQQMVTAGLALPADVEQAIFDRARGREDVLSHQQEQEAARALSSRGLRSPAGLLNKALQAVKDKARLTASGASRDVGIEVARMNVEAVRFGLSTLAQIDASLRQDHVTTQGLLLDAAKAAHAALIEVFNGQVALHNAQWEGFKAEAQVFEARIRALAAQADVLKTRIEAEKVKGDVNESLVRAYGEKIRSLSALADMHRAQVEAAKAKGEINMQRLEQVRLRLQAYGIDVDAYGKVWDAYKTQVDAEATSLRYGEVQANIHGQRIGAWRTAVEAQSSRANTQIAVQGQVLDAFRASLAGVATRVQAQSANVDAAARIFQAQTGLFAAQGQVSAAEAAAGDRTNELRMQQSRLLFESSARNAEIAGNYGLKKVEMAIEGHRGSAQVWSQLAASVMSGVNLGASASESWSTSTSYSGN